MMGKRVNTKSNHLSVAVGDYVYLLQESSKIGQKLQNKYDRPFEVDSIESPCLVVPVDHVTGKKLDRSFKSFKVCICPTAKSFAISARYHGG